MTHDKMISDPRTRANLGVTLTDSFSFGEVILAALGLALAGASEATQRSPRWTHAKELLVRFGMPGPPGH
jgi:hypothetical protein